jgi:hypothetical protein
MALIRRAFPKNVQFALAFSCFVLQHASDDQARRFLDGIPAASRLLVRLLGQREFNAYRHTVYGRR